MQIENTERHGLSSDEARELSQRILGFAQADNTRVNVFSGIRGFTRTAVNRVTTAGTSDDTTVRITSVFGKRVASADTNQLDDTSLERAVAQSEALARISPEDPEYLPELGEQAFREVDGYYASTGDLTTESRARAASSAIDIVEESDSVAAGFIDVRAGSEAIATSNGLFGYHSQTNVASSLTVRTPDGGSSGWAGDEGADWSSIDSERIAEDAVQKCQDWRNPTPLEPGFYDVILEPTAVGNLMVLMMRSFGARQADEGRSFFSGLGGGNRLGEELFDERITIVSDPAEPNSETPPFSRSGLPVGRNVWVENGELKTLSYSRFWAEEKEVAPRPLASNLVMSGGDATLEDMIRDTQRGVLITRFWYIRSLNPRTIAYTGLTRDGTFLIQDGQITRPVNNFRFNQSLTDMLASIEMLGRPTRVSAFGDAQSPPIVVPPLKVRNFQLSSVSEAV